MDITIKNVNNVPVADAGDDQTVAAGSLVTLDGSGSFDTDGEPLGYLWEQTAGSPVALSVATAITPTFTAPLVGIAGEMLTFRLTVSDGIDSASDGRGGSSTDQVSITVRDLNAPPDCSRATASPLSLWPPNHKMVPVQITGVTDPEDPVRLTIFAVRQDEPTNGLGDGDTAPDAAINPDGSLLLRAEWSGKGDGRVYHVSFAASDGVSGECSGAVSVCVPHSARRSCGDGGTLYDSTQP